jgi:hypothetical protein
MSAERTSDPLPGGSSEPRCSFCGRTRWETGSLVESPARPSESKACICLDCAETCRASQIRHRGAGRLLLRYSWVIWLCGIGGAILFGVGSQQRQIWPVLRDTLPELGVPG